MRNRKVLLLPPNFDLLSMTNLVVLSYGDIVEYQRVILAVLSYQGWLATAGETGRTVVFTDNPAYLKPYFAGLTVDYRLLTPPEIREMKGPVNFVHRLKVAVLAEAFSRYPDDSLLYVDSDTFAFKNPKPLLARISPTVSAMHQPEYTLEAHRHQGMGSRLLHLLESESFTTSRGEERFRASQTSWNAGVLGLAPTVAASMADVFLLTDRFFSTSGWHVSEQLAFSLVLQTRTQVIPSDDFIYHYWQATHRAAVDALLPGILTPDFMALPLPEKAESILRLTQQLLSQIAEYLAAHPEIELRVQALDSLHLKNFAAGYRLAGRYLLKKPMDTQFIRDIIYHTRQRLLT